MPLKGESRRRRKRSPFERRENSYWNHFMLAGVMSDKHAETEGVAGLRRCRQCESRDP